MRVTFWGTRGSCPTFPSPRELQEYSGRVSVATVEATTTFLADQLRAGRSLDDLRQLLQRPPEELARELRIERLPVFGGETTCVEVETSEGHTLILDWGSGVRHCAAKVMRERSETNLRELHLFGSHVHLDHRIGLSFAGFCFADPPFDIRVYGTSGVLKAMDEHFGFFSQTVSESTYNDDPIDYRMATATFHGTEIQFEGAGTSSQSDSCWERRDMADAIQIGSTVVRPFRAFHGKTDCLGYKIEHGGKSFVFSTDHERLAVEGPDQRASPEKAQESREVDERLGEMCRGADLAYFDGQYTRDEYFGRRSIDATPAVPRIGWGHGCIEDILDRVSEAGVKHALIGHHDPERSWPDQVAMNEYLMKHSAAEEFQVELARDGQVIEL